MRRDRERGGQGTDYMRGHDLTDVYERSLWLLFEIWILSWGETFTAERREKIATWSKVMVIRWRKNRQN